MSRQRTSEETFRLPSEAATDVEISNIFRKYSIDEHELVCSPAKCNPTPASDSEVLKRLQQENCNLKRAVSDLVGELRLAQTRLSNAQSEVQGCEAHGRLPHSHPSVQSLLEMSRIIPAIRTDADMGSAMASPTAIVWLLFGTPLTLGCVVRRLRAAGKLPVANLDLLTGFAQDRDAVELLVQLGVAGVVSTRQSVLRAAHAHGIIAVQRTFIVDSIAVGNVVRSLQHFLPDAVELLPAAAAPLCMSALRAIQPQIPVIATGLVTSMRQVEELMRCGVTSVATSDNALWVV